MADVEKIRTFDTARRARRSQGTPQPGLRAAGPLDRTGQPLFEEAAKLDPRSLLDELRGDLDRFRGELAEDPFSNPVSLLALDLSRRLERGEIAHADLELLVQTLTVDGFVDRADRLGRYIGELDPDENERRLEALFRELATGPDGSPDFDRFRKALRRESFGVVMTAHPTFSLSGPLMRQLAALACRRSHDGSPLDDEALAAIIETAAAAEHRSDPDISLAREHELSIEAIMHLQAALRRAFRVVLKVARDCFPDRWTEVVPRLLTIASWVGYDLDGRSDIRWTDSLHTRILLQTAQLRHYMAEVEALRQMVRSGNPDLVETLDLMESRIALSLNQLSAELQIFAPHQVADNEANVEVQAVSRQMYDGRGLRLVEASTVSALVDRAIEKALKAGAELDPVAERLAVLRAELATHGLGLAHTHVRINATQVHNAIRKTVGLVSDPNDPRYRVSYLDRLTELLDAARPVSINFGSMLSERTSVKRLFMLVAQMLKYYDRSAPIRFLIAECESAFTVLTALYYARLFGVDGDVDISPLFETEKALEGGSRVIEQLLENPHFRDYVKRRGRLCIQTGFSDAGRYLGQTPAAASIERLRQRLIRVVAKSGLDDVQLLIFDTHGESIGRGAHPGSFEDRLSYIDSGATRAQMAEAGVAFKQEVSFQGGDGYLYFVHPVTAFAVLTRILEHALGSAAGRPDPEAVDDPFYDEAAYIREFFTTVKEFQVGLMNDGNYGVLLSAFGANLLFPSGSRALKRQHEDASEVDHAHPSQFRAIPHNAVLIQLGLLANVVGGVGAAVTRDPERFAELHARSPRFRRLLGIVEYGAAVSDPIAMRAYIDVLDPGSWITRAAATGDRARAEQMLALADHLEASGVFERQMRVFRKLHKDFTQLVEGLRGIDTGGGTGGIRTIVPDRARDAMQILHAIRIAVIQEIFLLAMRVPEFSNRHETTLKQLVARILHLDVPTAARLLEDIFPATDRAPRADDFGEPATYRSDETQSYRFENERLFKPLKGLYTLVRRISTATTHRVGFFG